jgi:hypothetical protein
MSLVPVWPAFGARRLSLAVRRKVTGENDRARIPRTEQPLLAIATAKGCELKAVHAFRN